MPLNGLVVMTPSSVASTGTGNSSSIDTDGSVAFSSCATLSLNGVFTSSYDNYMVVFRHLHSSGDSWFGFRMRVSGTDNSTSNSYTTQRLSVDATTLTAARELNNLWARFFYASATQRSGTTAFVFAPYLTQPTRFKSLTASGFGQTSIADAGGVHNQSTSYDGFTLVQGGVATLSGNITVYGFNK